MTLEEWEAKHAPRLRSAVIDHMSAYNLIAWPDDEPETREDFIRAVLISVRDQLGNVARNDISPELRKTLEAQIKAEDETRFAEQVARTCFHNPPGLICGICFSRSEKTQDDNKETK